MPFAAIQMNLETVTLSEVNQTEENKYMIQLIHGILKKKKVYKRTYLQTETELQMVKKINLWLLAGKGRR